MRKTSYDISHFTEEDDYQLSLQLARERRERLSKSDPLPPEMFHELAEEDRRLAALAQKRDQLLSDPDVWVFDSETWLRHQEKIRNVIRAYDAKGHSDTVTNARIKRYPHMDLLQVANSPIFPVGDYERLDTWEGRKRMYDVPSKGQAADPLRSMEESKRRAKSKVRDIALCNRFEYMFTWTLSSEQVDRYDHQEVYKKMRGFLSNATQRKGFTYVCIPEYHALKEGEERPGIHFHGLCSLGKVKVVPALLPSGVQRHDKAGRPVFNMTDWVLGYSTCVPLDENYEKAVSYITKYITKQENKIFGKWYLSSRSIKKGPDILPIDVDINYEDFRDPDKLATNRQYETTAFLDVKIVSEEFKHELCDNG